MRESTTCKEDTKRIITVDNKSHIKQKSCPVPGMNVGCMDFWGILYKSRNTVTAGGGITFDCCVYLLEIVVFVY